MEYGKLQRRRGTALWRAMGVSALFALAACGNEREADVVETLPPQPYGEEEANVQLWLETMELSSRELYAAREAVVDAIGLRPGDKIADIGSGTGLYTILFSPVVGDAGNVFAVDIEPRFLKLTNQRVADLDIRNVVSVLSREDDITLPSGSVDVVFIADTYHYIAEPARVMDSVRRALAPGGRVVIIDYDNGDAVANDEKHSHVRFGRAALIEEVQSFGFRLANEPKVEGLSDYYMTVFEKTDR